MKIAIIGAGISGLGAAYLLSKDHDVTLYERNAYIGGHSRTIDIKPDGKNIPVDTGFIVFNNWNYPNLTGLFKHLDIPYDKSDMSFGVCIDNGWLEYSSSSIFAQRKNLIRPQFWKMLYDIVRFNLSAKKYLKNPKPMTLGEYLDDLGVSQWFRDYYLLAMGAAIWSCPINTIMGFPAQVYLRFFKNHGLLNIIKRPQWYTVRGGSRTYVQKLLQEMEGHLQIRGGVTKVAKATDGIDVKDDKGTKHYDHVIFACHADEALALLENPSDTQRDVLKDFTYQQNRVVVHTDESFMPKAKKSWASWVYLNEGLRDEKPVVSLSYWMNNLQNLDTDKAIIITLNPGRTPDKATILDEHIFEHPVFDTGAINAQDKIEAIQGMDNISFCGAYQRYGFHEDGLWSAVRVAEKLGAKIPWR